MACVKGLAFNGMAAHEGPGCSRGVLRPASATCVRTAEAAAVVAAVAVDAAVVDAAFNAAVAAQLLLELHLLHVLYKPENPVCTGLWENVGVKKAGRVGEYMVCNETSQHFVQILLL